MLSRSNLLIVVFFSLYLIYHFYTLALYPMPWFDEVFFASVGRSLSQSGELIGEISKEMWGDEKIIYHGPVYYLLESASYKFFGFGILQTRWIALFFGVLTVIATAVLFRYYHRSSNTFWILAILFLLDPFLNMSLHDGRMDFPCIFFMLLAIYWMLKGVDGTKNNLLIFSGLAASLSILTSPRVAVVYIAVGLVFIMSLEGRELKSALWSVACWVLPVFVLYSIWTFYAYGGYVELYNYYQNLPTLGMDYVGGKFYIPRHEYLLILLTSISIVYGIIKKRKEYFTKLVFISLTSIILFYIIVIDWGPHSTLILPFYYFLLFHGFSDVRFSWKSISLYPLLTFLAFNLIFFQLKSVQILSARKQRNHDIVKAFVQQHIPKGSKVAGSPHYYYAVIESGSQYRLYDQFLGAEKREQLLREVYDYDYLFVANRTNEMEPFLTPLFLSKGRFLKVAELRIPSSPLTEKIESLGIVSNAEREGYNGTLYIRVKEDKVFLGMTYE